MFAKIGFAALLVSAALLPAQQAAESQKTDLNGTWKINRDQSDDAREKLRSAMEDRDRNGPMGSHTGMGGVGLGIPGIGGIGGMGHPGGPGPGRGSGAGNEEQRTRLATLVAASDQLTIVDKGPEIDVTDSDRRERSLFTDGRKIEKSKENSSQVAVKARWEHGTLITEEKGPNGEKISHAYERTEEGKQLADTLTLESKRLNTPIIVRSVYDKAGADKGE
jgi:hypothetical protein